MGKNEIPKSSLGLREARLQDRFSLAAVLLLTTVTYLGTLRFGFVYDDFQQILSNPFVKSWRYVPQLFTSSVWKQLLPFDPGNYYRPLFLVWIRLNYSVFANRAMGWHATAIALHLGVTFLVFLIVRKMTARLTAAWLTALIFGLHPIHHEVVAWVSATTESLFAAMFLAGFLAYLESRERSKSAWMLVSCAFYALAMLCKETAIVLPALVFAHSWIADASEEQGKQGRYLARSAQAIKWTGPYLPIALVYLAVRYSVLSGFGHLARNASFSAWVLTLPSVLLFYVKNWFFPVRLSEDYDLFYQLRPDFAHVILPALILIALAITMWLVRNYLGPRDASLALMWIIIPLLPALDFVVFRGGELVHDRYFYVPSIGAALLVALCFERMGNTRQVVFGQPMPAMMAGLGLALVLSIATIRATSFWSDDFTLFERAHEVAPRNLNAIDNLGVDLIERNEIDRAQALFEAGLREDSSDALFLFNLGRLQYIRKNYPVAEEFTRKSISYDPNAADSFASLGKIELKENRPNDAVLSFRHAVELSPYDAPFHASYGVVLALNGDCPAAMVQFEAALALNPGDGISQMEISRCRNAGSSETPAGGNSSQSRSGWSPSGAEATQAASETPGK